MSGIPLESTMKILVCDPIAEDGVEIFRKAGANVDVKTGMWRATYHDRVRRFAFCSSCPRSRHIDNVRESSSAWRRIFFTASRATAKRSWAASKGSI